MLKFSYFKFILKYIALQIPSQSESQCSDWVCSQDEDEETAKRNCLDGFLNICGISPVKKRLSCPWESASSRTKSDYIKKTEKIFQEVLCVLAPGQEDKLKEAYFENQNGGFNIDLNIVANAYTNACDWGTQRQILSLIAPNYQLQTLQTVIPNLTKYRYTAARKHSTTLGSGMPVICAPYSREGITSEQVSHFLDFVLSPVVMTDIPYGENKLKLSSGEILEVPKIIINSVRSRVVELYQQYCVETEYSGSASSRSCMRMLKAVEPSVRKSMKGLDNYAAEGAKAIDDLKHAAETLGLLGKGADWVTGVKQSLSAGKQYLKLEYKVSCYVNQTYNEMFCQDLQSL